jgi:hypothetical protein
MGGEIVHYATVVLIAEHLNPKRTGRLVQVDVLTVTLFTPGVVVLRLAAASPPAWLPRFTIVGTTLAAST